MLPGYVKGLYGYLFHIRHMISVMVFMHVIYVNTPFTFDGGLEGILVFMNTKCFLLHPLNTIAEGGETPPNR